MLPPRPGCRDSGARRILTLRCLAGEGFTHAQVITLWCFNIVGREILTLGEGFNTQVITLWCFNIVDTVATARPAGIQSHSGFKGIGNRALLAQLNYYVLAPQPLLTHSAFRNALQSHAPGTGWAVWQASRLTHGRSPLTAATRPLHGTRASNDRIGLNRHLNA
jgi:hypothetical protein